MKSGFFTVDELHMICDSPDIDEAKNRAHGFVKWFCQQNKKVQPKNVAKVKNMIDRSLTVEQLGISAANFMLAHPSENLAMNRGEDAKPKKKNKKK